MSTVRTLCRFRISLRSVLIAAALIAGSLQQSAIAFEAPSAGIEEVETALKLSDAETQALAAVTDRVSQWKEPAFYMLLDRVSKLPRLSQQGFADLDQPAYRSLLTQPQKYRGCPVRLKVHVFRVLKMSSQEPKGALGYSPLWPKEKVVWRMFCATATDQYEQQPIVVFATFEPGGLGKPDKITIDGEQQYPLGPQLELAAVFYKIYQDKEKTSGKLRDYPLLLGWQSQSAGHRATEFWLHPAVLYPSIAIGAVAIGYYFLRRHVRDLRRKNTRPKYRPKQDAETTAQQPAASNGVDPLLKEAAEQYKESQQSDD